jgi:hypothetical protein
VITAAKQGFLGEKSGLTPLQPRAERTSLGSFTQATVAGTATSNTDLSTALGWKNGEPLVIDVTIEILGGRREDWRDGYEAGIRSGTQRVLQSEAVLSMAFELTLLRAVTKGLQGLVAELEHQAEYWHWKAARAGDREACE